MAEHVYLLTICLPLAAIVLIFGMRYFSAVQQARARRDSDEAYRAVAEKAATAGTETAAALAAIGEAVADMRTRLAAVEKILKDVE